MVNKENAEQLNSLFHLIKLKRGRTSEGEGYTTKIEQIVAYLDVIESQMNKLSKKNKLVLVDSGAGNCYLSFLVYYYFKNIMDRDIEIHCIDSNKKLMNNCKRIAESLDFDEIYFYSCDITEFSLDKNANVTYSLHACDNATDKALYLGLKLNAQVIFGVSCCQHSLAKNFKSKPIKGVTRYKAFKNRLLYIVADTMRAHLLTLNGYKVDIFDFTSTKNTDKNIMIRAIRQPGGNKKKIQEEYDNLHDSFNIKPMLEDLIAVG